MTQIPNLTEEQLKECLEHLTHYAVKKFFLYGWGGSNRIGPRATSPDDLAAEAIVSLIKGNRNYYSEIHGELMTFLRSAVDSEIWNLSCLVEHKKRRPLPQETNGTSTYLSKRELRSNETDPVQTCINRELIEKLETILAPDFKKDKLIRELFDCWKAGKTTRRDIADELGVKVREIDKARKRLLRRLKKAGLL